LNLSREEVWTAMPDAPTSTSKASTTKTTRSTSTLAKRKSKDAARYAAAHWLAVILTVIAVVFIVQNRQHISIDFFWANLSSPMWLVLLITAAVGVAIGYLISRRRQQ
jgi:putative membrane protein